jgi:hypothetical protein
MTSLSERLMAELAHLGDVDALEALGLEMRNVSASTTRPSIAALRAVEAAATRVVEAANSLPRLGGSQPMARLLSLRVGSMRTRAVVCITINHRSTLENPRTATESAGSSSESSVDSQEDNHQFQEVEVEMERAEAEVAMLRAEVAMDRAEAEAEAEVVEVTAAMWGRARGQTLKRKAAH